MNNPYRARPTRSRPDHTAGYKINDLNVVGPVSRTYPGILPNDSHQHQQPPIADQSKETNDRWDDSWNWNLDQQSEANQQQQQRHQQHQHYVQPYTNQGHIISNTAQDQYFQNLNGNNKSDSLGHDTLRMGPNRQPMPVHSDTFMNYNQNQQYSFAANSVKSGNVPPFSHSQWSHEQRQQQQQQQQSFNTSYSQGPVLPSQKDQAYHPPLSSSNYNWGKPEQHVHPAQNNWSNRAEVPAQWQDLSMEREIRPLDEMGNQHPQSLPQAQTTQTFASSNDGPNKEHSVTSSNEKQGIIDINNWANQNRPAANQWQGQNRETIVPKQHESTPSTYSEWNYLNSWNDTIRQESQQPTAQNELHSDQWLEQQEENSSLQDTNIPQDGVTHKSGETDWRQAYSLQYSTVNTSATTELVATTGNKEQHKDEKKFIPGLAGNSVLPGDSIVQKGNGNWPQADDHFNTALRSKDSLNTNSENISIENKNDCSLMTDGEWKADSADEIVNSVGQLSISSKSNKQFDKQSQPSEPQNAVSNPDEWSQQPVPNFAANDITMNATPDNMPVLPSDYSVQSMEKSHTLDNPPTMVQEHVTSATSQSAAPKLSENLSQSGYDQWYKQTTALSSSANEWVYTTDENMENCENIQQPTEFVNLEVVTPGLQERDIYGSRDSINKETLDNDPKVVINRSKEALNARDFRQEGSNVEVPIAQQQVRVHPPLQTEQMPDNYEFASNDRNTFLETGELTDSHQEHESTPLSQDDENDEVPNDIPFLREVPGQSSSTDPRRNDPTGQEQYIQAAQRLSDPRRNDPSGQEQNIQVRSMSERTDRRDVPPGQERSVHLLQRNDSDTLERRNDPSGREGSLPPQQSRNDPSGEERYQSQPQMMLEPSETREIPGRGNELEDSIQQPDSRQIPGGTSPNDAISSQDDRANGRVVTGSQEVPSLIPPIQDPSNDSRIKREEAVGASVGESQGVSTSLNRRNSFENIDDEASGNTRDDSRERRRDSSPERRRYEYDRKGSYYDRDREYDVDYYYDRRRGGDMDRPYNSRDDFERREGVYRDDDRKHHSRDDLDRHSREDLDRRGRKDELDDRDGRRRPLEDRRRDRSDDPRRREAKDYDSRYSRERDYVDRDRRRDDRRPRRYDDYDVRDPYRREFYEDPYSRSSRPSSRSSYNDRDREYYLRTRDPYYVYNGYNGYDYMHYGNNYYAYFDNLRRTNPAAYAEWYHKYYANQHQQQHMSRSVNNYPEDRASVHSGRSSCDDRFFMNPSACFHSPNKALYVSYFGYPGQPRTPLQRCGMTCPNRVTSDKRNLTDMSLEDSTIASARMTPTKFSTSHGYGCFSIGSLVHVHPSYPVDGERAKVDIFRLDNLLAHDPVARDLRTYPGPLIKGVTHKKTIIEYCESKIKKAADNEEMIDRASYILLYELMIMLIQQNGNVVGVDIAALLLRNKDAYPYDVNKNRVQDNGRRESVISQRSGATGGDGGSQDSTTISDKNDGAKPCKTIEQITDEFRNTLLYGLVQEALESAMSDGLWGHALFLASKLDKRTHASVMARFANSLPPHDPLQTLYQLHSGRVPTIVTSVTDTRLDDWRPHLAMIISNTSTNPEINRRSITTLGDTLCARGNIHAAHFCYILAQVDFGCYGVGGIKLVLIGANHNKSYTEFMTTEAVMLTEIYEYARNLSEPGFTLADLQTFKFELAMKMVDCGLTEKALLYIEQIAVNITSEPSKYKKSFISAVYNLGDRIKYHDPVCKDSIEDVASLTWLNNLAEIVGKCQTGEIVEENPYNSQIVSDERSTQQQNREIYENKPQQPQQQWNTAQLDYGEGPTSMMEVPSTDMQSHWQPLSLPSNIPDAYDQSVQYARNKDSCNPYQQSSQPQDYWGQQSYYPTNYVNNDVNTSSNWQQQQQQSSRTPYSSEQAEVDSAQQQETWNYEAEKEDNTPTPEPSQPAISMTPSTGKQYDPLEELDALETPKTIAKPAGDVKKQTEKTSEKKPSSSGGSWFGGLFSKLAPKPKNQMILPDDSNPTIVWDPVAKKWMNKDEDTDGGSTTLGPPPRASEIGFRAPVSEPSTLTPQTVPTSTMQTDESTSATNVSKLATSGNMYKLPKVRNMRANYIDVMNPGGSKSNAASSNIPTPAISPLVSMATSSPQLFVPAPVNDPSAPMDFLTATPTPSTAAAVSNGDNVTQGLSRWSSTSSLSREVQSYTMRDPRLLQRNKGPMTYNTGEMNDRTVKNTSQSRYPPR